MSDLDRTKSTVSDLAILGGRPLFETPRYVGRPNIGDRRKLLERFTDILDRNWLTNDGPMVKELEARLVELTGTRNCVAVTNGTVGLELVARALALEGEVIVPAFTFIATAHAFEWLGIRPVLCDVRPTDFTIDASMVEALVTRDTTAIVGVHLWGRPCDVDGLSAIASEHGLSLVFDAAHAIGCTHGGVSVGRFGSAEVLSFHATKVINSFEGGAVLTEDDDLAERLRRFRNFGFTGVDSVDGIGTNAKMSEISAAMGITSLDAFDVFVSHNRSVFDTYQAGLEDVPGIQFLSYDESEQSNFQYAVVLVESATFGFNADILVSMLAAEGIVARRYFKPGLHQIEPYRSRERGPSAFPVTDFVVARSVVLPSGMATASEDATAIANCIRFIHEHAATIAETVRR